MSPFLLPSDTKGGRACCMVMLWPSCTMKRANRCPLYRAGGGGLVLDLMKLDKIEQGVIFVSKNEKWWLDLWKLSKGWFLFQKMKSDGWTCENWARGFVQKMKSDGLDFKKWKVKVGLVKIEQGVLFKKWKSDGWTCRTCQNWGNLV